jgi:hypothetical protein
MAESGTKEITVRDLYPRLSEEELQCAEEKLEQYLALELRVFERLLRDPDAYARFGALTASEPKPMMGGERSNPALKT